MKTAASKPPDCVVTNHAIEQSYFRVVSSLDGLDRADIIREMRASVTTGWSRRKLVFDFQGKKVLLIPWRGKKAFLVLKPVGKSKKGPAVVVLTVLDTLIVEGNLQSGTYRLIQDYADYIEA